MVPKEVWQVARVVMRGRMGGHMRRGRVAMVVMMVVVATQTPVRELHIAALQCPKDGIKGAL